MAKTLCTYFNIGPRTRKFRNGANLQRDMMEAIGYAATLPGYYSEETQKALAVGFGVVLAWQKHVEAYRLPGEQVTQLIALCPYQFAQTLAKMVDDGVTNCGEADAWFRAQRVK